TADVDVDFDRVGSGLFVVEGHPRVDVSREAKVLGDDLLQAAAGNRAFDVGQSFGAQPHAAILDPTDRDGIGASRESILGKDLFHVDPQKVGDVGTPLRGRTTADDDRFEAKRLY